MLTAPRFEFVILEHVQNKGIGGFLRGMNDMNERL